MKIYRYKTLLAYLLPYKLSLSIIFINTVISNVLALFLPILMADIVDVGIKQKGIVDSNTLGVLRSESEVLNNQISYITSKGLIMLALTLVILMLTIWTSYFVSKLSAGISASLRSDMFKKIMNFSYMQSEEFSFSSLITRVINDVESVKNTILMSTQIIIPPLMVIGGVVMALKTCSSMSWTIAVGSVVSVIAVTICFKLITPKVKILSSLTDKFNRVIQERLSGIMTIRSFEAQELECRKFKQSNGEFISASLFISRITAMLAPILTICINLITIAVIWIGAFKIYSGEMNIGEVMAFLQYVTMTITAFLMLSVLISSLPKAWVSVERVCEVLDKKCENTLQKCKYAEIGNSMIKNIEFNNVYFKYLNAQKCVLEDINFSVRSGESLGIIGATGSGKSTLVKLLAGLYTPEGGDVLINGINLSKYEKKSIMDRFAYVPQSGALFSGDIAANLRISNNLANDNDLWDALKVAQIYDFVKEKGLDFNLSQGGSNISGGQRQRLAVARALVRDADVYIFDDSFSKLDFITEMNIRKALKDYMKESIYILISQRIGMLKTLDKILVLSDGKIVGAGNHSELIKNCSGYREIVKLQLCSEEIL